MHSFDKHLGLALGAVLLQNGQQHLLVHFVDLQFSGLVIRSLPVKKKTLRPWASGARCASGGKHSALIPTLSTISNAPRQSDQNRLHRFVFFSNLIYTSFSIIVMDYSCTSLFPKPKLSALRLLILCIERFL